MAMIRSFTVGNGDMFYIKHYGDNFTIIDCQLFGEHKEWLVEELKVESKDKNITRFISTHPDEDHLQGIEYLDEQMPITNFYVVKNNASKMDESESFKHYCRLRDSDKAYYVYKGCVRRWMNQSDDGRGSSGINILWPDTSNEHFKAALQNAAKGKEFNNVSLVARYAIEGGASFMWVGDLETQFMEDIFDDIELPETTIVFAPHHGRKSGKLPNAWLDKLKPKIIVIGEAPSRHLHYYNSYNTITQTSAKDITFIPDGNRVHCYASCETYGKRDWLDDENKSDEDFGVRDRDYYVGTVRI
jgi:beta-lactamase superfamily II metal-dependent hydrolase